MWTILHIPSCVLIPNYSKPLFYSKKEAHKCLLKIKRHIALSIYLYGTSVRHMGKMVYLPLRFYSQSTGGNFKFKYRNTKKLNKLCKKAEFICPNAGPGGISFISKQMKLVYFFIDASYSSQDIINPINMKEFMIYKIN